MKHLLCILILLTCSLSTCLADRAKPHTVTVNGKGQIEVEPDFVKVNMGASMTKRVAAEAKTEIDKIFKKLVAVFKEQEIDKKDINTSVLYIHPDYDYRSGSIEFKGYEVSRYAQVILRDLDKLNALLQESLESGVTQVDDIQLLSSRETELREAALRQAVSAAKQKAALLAKEFGVSTGKVTRIECVDRHLQDSDDLYGYGGPMLMTDAEPVSGSFMKGLIKFEAQVIVEFELKNED